MTSALYQRSLKQTEQYKQTMRLAREEIDRLPSEGAEAIRGCFNLACTRADCAALLRLEKEQ